MSELLAGLLSDADRCRSVPNATEPVLTLSDVAAILTDGRARFPHVTLTRNGVPLPPREFCSERTVNGTPVTGLVAPEKVERLLAAGASIVLNELETYWPDLTAICADLEERTGLDIGAMAFVSPPHRGAFPLHQDPVHVVVLHCAGTKEWAVFDHFTGQDAAGPVQQPKGATPRHVLTFGPGDAFSMPAGHPHRATSSASWSVHVSITAKHADPLAQVKDEIRAAVRRAANADDPAQVRAAVVAALSRAPQPTAPRSRSRDRRPARERLTAIMREARG